MKIVSPSPHLHSGDSTKRIMRDVVIALLPALGFSLVMYGFNALSVTVLAVISCMFFEWFIGKFLLKQSNSLTDWSAAVTGMLLAFNLPAEISPWLVILGSLVAMGIGKMSFGGLGKNLFNPALVGRVFLLISFPVQMTVFPDTAGLDAVTGATPLAFVKEALSKGQSVSQIMPSIDLQGMILGFKDGSLGEIAGVLLIIGGLYLLVRRVITWEIPVFTLGSMALFSTILWLINPEEFMNPLFHLFAGGALLGAIFMATDYVSSPMSRVGQMVFGVGIGIITILIRVWGAYPEGISFAILIMNACVPLINMYIKPKRFA
ncbi:MAG: RnfABCDGE type electron transport complex subunit D [Mucinivorans sp.]